MEKEQTIWSAVTGKCFDYVNFFVVQLPETSPLKFPSFHF